MKVTMIAAPEDGESQPPKKKAKGGAMPQPMPEDPSPAERMVNRAHDAKVDATDRWVRGEISSAKHEQTHKRADRVIRTGGKFK